ncbi:MAG: twin-arginine translocation signal domain-containing protein, partial [Steroidobacteraceae bacterium]
MDRRRFLQAVATLAAWSAFSAQDKARAQTPARPAPARGPRRAKSRMVFISDTHIGIGDRTNWYQRDVHESALIATLDYVSNNADSIAELILL